MKIFYTLFVLIFAVIIGGLLLLISEYQTEIITAAISAIVGILIGWSWGSVSQFKKRAKLENELDQLHKEIAEIKVKIEASKQVAEEKVKLISPEGVKDKKVKKSFSSKLMSVFNKKISLKKSEPEEQTNGEEDAE